jgi:hypothetical protein
VKIRSLEDGLLQALFEVKGSILESDKVIATMEELKKEGKKISIEMEKTESVMQEVTETTTMYAGLAHAAARVYFSLESLGDIFFLYRYSLDFFFEMFNSSLKGLVGGAGSSILGGQDEINSSGGAASRNVYEKRLTQIITVFFSILSLFINDMGLKFLFGLLK